MSEPRRGRRQARRRADAPGASRRRGRRARRVAAAAPLALLLAAAGAAGAERPPQRLVSPAADTVPRELIVRFRPGVAAAARRAARARAGVRLERPLPLPGRQLVHAEGRGVAAALRALRRDPRVAAAQRNLVYRARAAPTSDPHFNRLWGIANPNGVDVGALRAWDLGRGGGAVIAILDTGVARDHPDLAPNLLPGRDHVDDDVDPDDLNGAQGHGSHVAGIAAAAGNNGRGGVGVAYGARILPERVLDRAGLGSTDVLIEGVLHAAGRGADVLNLSLGGDEPDPTLDEALRSAAAAGAVIVAAAGNDGRDLDGSPSYPCASPVVHLCVTAIDRHGGLAAFANRGRASVDLGAPGVDVLSAHPGYRTKLSDDFEGASFDESWERGGFGAGWGFAPFPSPGGSTRLQDSPGAPYEPDTDSFARRRAGVDLSGASGCLLDYRLRLDTELRDDGLTIGTDELPLIDGLTGRTVGFERLQTGLEPLDGRAAVRLRFGLLADDDGAVGDGALLDDVVLECRSHAPADVERYGELDGTSMAAPHAAGAAAILAGLFPSARPAQLVRLLVASAAPLPALRATTASGGRVDAGAAVARALATRPACGPAAAVTRGPAVRLPLRCSDPDGEPVRVSVSRPTAGSLGPLDPAARTVVYRPRPRFEGRDLFGLTGTDGIAPSAPATLTVDVDRTRPRIVGLRMSRRAFAVGRSATSLSARAARGGARAARRRARGSAFLLRLSEAAQVEIRVERRLAGLRLGRRCRARTPAALARLARTLRLPPGAARRRALARLARRRACVLHRRAGAPLRRRARAGRGVVPFSGRIGRRALRAGPYRALLVAVDRAGNRSARRAIGFRVVRS